MLAAILGAAISAIGGMASAGMSNAATKENLKLQSKLNKEQMNHSSMLQRNQQEWLFNTMYGKNVSSMKNAGLNPAMANGTTPTVPSASSPGTGPSGPQGARVGGFGLEMLQGIKQMQLMNAEEKLLDAQAKNQEADAKNKEQQTLTEEQRTLMLQYENTPFYRNLGARVLDSQSLEQYARANVNTATVNKLTQEVHNLSQKYKLDVAQERQINQATANLTAEYEKIVAQIGSEKAHQLYMRASASLASEQAKDLKSKNNSGFWSNQSAKTLKETVLLGEKQTTEIVNQNYTNVLKQLSEFENRVNEVIGVEGVVVGKSLSFLPGILSSLKSKGNFSIKQIVNKGR